MNRTAMRRCGKQYASEWAARNSKGWEPGMTAVLCPDPACRCWHLRKPPARTPVKASATPTVKVPAPRSAPGHMRAAVAMVLAGERTVADAAREFSVDPDRLTDQAERAFRTACMERDSYQCQHCGAPATEVQHRVARGMGGTDDPVIAFGRANGVSLCGESHRLAETRAPEMRALGFWLTRDQDPAAVPVYVATEYGYQRTFLLADGTASLDEPEGLAAVA